MNKGLRRLERMARVWMAEGKCRACGTEADGYVYCEKHRAYYRDLRKEKLQPLREKGLCLTCGGERPCRACSKRNIKRQRDKRKERRALGLCTCCGGEREDTHYVQCEGCREDNRNRDKGVL